jgi:hypothetical protein
MGSIRAARSAGKREAAPAMMLGAPIKLASTQGSLQNLDHHHG